MQGPGKILIAILGFYLLAVVEQSFFRHFFGLFGQGFNLVLAAVFVLVVFSKQEERGFSPLSFLWGENNFSLLASFLAGLVLDFLSVAPFGVFTLTLTVSCLFLKKAAMVFQKSHIVSCALLFAVYLVFYKAFLLLVKTISVFLLQGNFEIAFSFSWPAFCLEFFAGLVLIALALAIGRQCQRA